MSISLSPSQGPPSVSSRLEVNTGVAACNGLIHRPRREALTLLAEVVALLHDVVLPVVNFVPACPAADGNRVALDFAIAAVGQVGRTLLLSADILESSDESGAHALSARVTMLLGGGNEMPVPDTSIPGLYHQRMDAQAVAAAAPMPPAAHAFKMIVVENASVYRSPVTLTQAASYHGSVLAVAAGVTRLQDVQATARQIRQAGGTVLGAVLFDVPSMRFGLSKRRAA